MAGAGVPAALEIVHFTDPACPFAFSAEPTRLRLRWHYGDQLRWRTRMIVLTLEPGEAEKLAQGAPGLQRRHAMPIDPVPRARPASSEPACRAIVAARLNLPDTEEPLLRRLRVRAMAGGLLDDPQLIAASAQDVGLDPARLDAWCATEQVDAGLRADIEAARSPSRRALALGHSSAARASGGATQPPATKSSEATEGRPSRASPTQAPVQLRPGRKRSAASSSHRAQLSAHAAANGEARSRLDLKCT